MVVFFEVLNGNDVDGAKLFKLFVFSLSCIFIATISIRAGGSPPPPPPPPVNA